VLSSYVRYISFAASLRVDTSFKNLAVRSMHADFGVCSVGFFAALLNHSQRAVDVVRLSGRRCRLSGVTAARQGSTGTCRPNQVNATVLAVVRRRRTRWSPSQLPDDLRHLESSGLRAAVGAEIYRRCFRLRWPWRRRHFVSKTDDIFDISSMPAFRSSYARFPPFRCRSSVAV